MSGEHLMNSNHVLVWWTLSIILIGGGILCAIYSGRRHSYLAGLGAAVSGGVGMLYTLQLIIFGGV